MANDEKRPQGELPQDEDDNRGATEEGYNPHPGTDPTNTVPDDVEEDAEERPN